MAIHEIKIDTNKKCVRCGRAGATQGGYCLECLNRNLQEGKYDHILTRKELKEVKEVASAVVENLKQMTEESVMPKIGTKTISFIEDAISGFLSSKKEMINEAYLKAGGDKLSIAIGITLAPGKRDQDVNVKVGISFVKDREKDEIEVLIDENQLSLYDNNVTPKSE